MRFVFLTPGTGYFFCGSCLRDHALAGALTREGHEVSVVPLYLPHVLEDPAAAQAATAAPLRLGGINMYLQQKSRLAGLVPRFLRRLLDRPSLLRWASRRGNMTDAPDLGPMTVSMLRGEDGRQGAELEELLDWLAKEPPPDFLVISNAMLGGIVKGLRRRLDCPILVTLQGELPFLDALPDPYREQAWAALRDACAQADGFIAVSRWYGEQMMARLGNAAGPCEVIHNGIDLGPYPKAPPRLAERPGRRLGFLARTCKDKGLHTLVEAFLLLKQDPRNEDLELHIAGAWLNDDKKFLAGLAERIEAAGAGARVDLRHNLSLSEKVEFLSKLQVFSVPATYGESFGLYLLEALASGVPVVQPEHAAFPELLAATGGGLLCQPDDAADLAAKIQSLLDDPTRAQALADAGRAAVQQNFAAQGMAARFLDVCRMLHPSSSRPH